MKKVAIIYWSGTGNTEAMANSIKQGAETTGNEVKLFEVSKANISDVVSADIVAIGCSSYGAEVLEDGFMEPFVESLRDSVKGKKVSLFGSFGWGSGEWMEDWDIRMASYGADLIQDSLIINETPDSDGLKQCEDFGKRLV